MGSEGHHDELDEFIRQTRWRQRNIVFPDTVRNTRSVNVFLWKGSADPSLVQQIGAWVFSLVFFGYAGAYAGMSAYGSREDDSAGFILTGALSLGAFAIGVRLFRNGFPRRPGR